MKTRLNIIFLALVSAMAALLAGCNGDLFIDSVALPDTAEYQVAGDDGQFSVPVSRQGLLRYYVSVKDNVTYYGVGGGTVTADSPADKVESILYETPIASFSVGLLGEMLYFTSYYNADYLPHHWTVLLEYEHGTKEVNVAVLPGKPMETVYVMEAGMIVDEGGPVDERTHSFTFNNGSSIEQTVDYMPYRSAQYTVTIVPDGDDNGWTRGLHLDPVGLLAYDIDLGEWYIENGGSIKVGEYLRPSVPYWNIVVVPFKVAPHTSVRIDDKILYSRASIPLSARFRNPVTGQEYDISMTMTSIYPVNYEIRTQSKDY